MLPIARFGFLAAFCMAFSACGRRGAENSAESPSARSSLPEECDPNVAQRMGIALGEMGRSVSGPQGGSNTALEMQQHRCREALEARRFNAEMAQQEREWELEKRRLELEQQRAVTVRPSEATEAPGYATSQPAQGSASPTGARVPTGKLLIFGGQSHETFLGCFCDPSDPASVLNEYGAHGNRFRRESIFNRFSEFGSDFSSTSACNQFATDPPVVVRDDGTFVGRLTRNQYKSGAIREERIVAWLENSVCAD